MADDNSLHDLFISYSRKNKDAVMPIKDDIERLGLTCWIDLSDIPCGAESFKKKVISGIKQARIALLFFLSADSQSSEYALREVNFAKKRAKKRVILIRFNDDEMTDDFFFDYQDADIIDWRVPEQKEKLLRDLKSWSSGDGGQLPGSPSSKAESKINDKYRQPNRKASKPKKRGNPPISLWWKISFWQYILYVKNHRSEPIIIELSVRNGRKRKAFKCVINGKSDVSFRKKDGWTFGPGDKGAIKVVGFGKKLIFSIEENGDVTTR
jgi:hypothetical protein